MFRQYVITALRSFLPSRSGTAATKRASAKGPSAEAASADTSAVTFSGYDPNIISFAGNKVTAKAPGKTFVTLEYEGLSRQVCICVMANEGPRMSELTGFFSPVNKYDVAISSPYASAIRPLVTYGDYSLHELGYAEISAMKVTFSVDDTTVCEVRKDGLITPVSPGKTVITVSCSDGLHYRVPVVVTE